MFLICLSKMKSNLARYDKKYRISTLFGSWERLVFLDNTFIFDQCKRGSVMRICLKECRRKKIDKLVLSISTVAKLRQLLCLLLGFTVSHNDQLLIKNSRCTQTSMCQCVLYISEWVYIVECISYISEWI